MSAQLVVQVVDVGARYGLHPSMMPLVNCCETVLIEPDPEEAERLKEQYCDLPNVQVMSVAAGTSQTPAQLLLRHHRGLSGFLDRTVETVGYLKRSDFQPERTVDVNVIPLKTVISELPTFLKLDCEGSELDALRSAEDKIQSVVGIRSEVSLDEVWSGGSVFQEIHEFLTLRDFQLLGFDSAEVGEEWGLMSLPNCKKRLVSADAIYLKNVNQLDSTAKVLALSLFCYLNGADGLGFGLLRNIKKSHLSSITQSDSGCEEILYAFVLRHLLEARKLPYYGSELVNHWHAEFFGSSIPNRSEIYSRLLRANLFLH